MELRNRLVMATQMWREATDDPLPRMPPGDPYEQLQAFELKLIDLLWEQATPQSARDVADKTWDLVHARSDDDVVKRRVVECHEVLARLPGASRPARRGDTRIPDVDGGRAELFDLASRRARWLTCSAGAAWGPSRWSSRTDSDFRDRDS